MSLRTQYLLRELFRFFAFFVCAIATMLLITQMFWSLAEALRHQGFPWREYVISFHANILLVFPMLTLLSIFFVFAELERFSEIEILEITGISSVQVLKVFFLFGLSASVLAFILGLFPPYPAYRLSTTRQESVSLVTEKFVIWAEKGEQEDLFNNVLLVVSDSNRSETSVYQAEHAFFAAGKLVLHSGKIKTIRGSAYSERQFETEEIVTPFDPRRMVEYVSVQMERLSFFRLRALLSTVKHLGIFSKRQWIILYQKLSYPLLNLFIVFLTIPFFNHRQTLSRFKIFSMGLGLSLLVYFIYSAGISLGEAELIPWRIAPWIVHMLMCVVACGYLLKMKKFSIIHSNKNA